MQNRIILSIPYESKEEFEESQMNLIREAINESLAQTVKRNEDDIFLTRKDVSKLLKISLPTLSNLTKEGKLAGYRLGGRVLYRKEDVIASLEKIETLKFKRAQ